jgi:hypothetical protein
LSSIDFCKASEFELASPQISQPGWSWSNTRKIPRVPSWSSAISIRAYLRPAETIEKLVDYFSARDHTYIAVGQVCHLSFILPIVTCNSRSLSEKRFVSIPHCRSSWQLVNLSWFQAPFCTLNRHHCGLNKSATMCGVILYTSATSC